MIRARAAFGDAEDAAEIANSAMKSSINALNAANHVFDDSANFEPSLQPQTSISSYQILSQNIDTENLPVSSAV